MKFAPEPTALHALNHVIMSYYCSNCKVDAPVIRVTAQFTKKLKELPGSDTIPTMKNVGRLISFEGPEGGGKSTHARELADRLRAMGINVMTTREPGGTPTGEAIRGILQHNTAGESLCDASEVLLFCASRAQLCEKVLAPALDAGTWVVCDRFTDSTLAYQGYGRGFDVNLLRQLNSFATGPVVPSLTILLDVPSESGLRRVAARTSNGAKDRIESESIDFHRRLRNGYIEIARSEPDRFIIIDANRPIELVSQDIWTSVTSRFGLQLS